MKKIAVLACAVLASGPAHPQAVFESTVTVVSLPLFVTDDSGQAVQGLTQDDFAVFDDGKPAKVVGFHALDAAAEDEPRAPGAPAAEPLPAAARRQFLLLFDLSFTNVHGIVKARAAALDFVTNRLEPRDLAAVATYSTSHGMKLLVSFTTDREQVRRAVETLGVVRVDRRADPLGLVYDMRELGAALADTARGERNDGFEDAVRATQVLFRQAELDGYRHRVVSLIEGLGQLATAIDFVQGRKQVIFFSSGFDESLLVGNQSTESTQDSEAVIRGRIWEVPSDSRFGDAGLRSQMDERLRGFARSDGVVHTIDVSGLTARGDARQSGPSEARVRNGQESLARIANISGGRLFKDTNDVGLALGEVLEMSRHYYLLAFEPPHTKSPGQFHKLQVRMKRKGLRLSHRTGYFERRPYAAAPKLAREFEASEVIAKGIDRGEIALQGLAVPYRTPEGVDMLPVVLEADAAALLGGRTTGLLDLDLYGYALGPDGDVRDALGRTARLDLAKVGLTGTRRGVQFHATFTLAPGAYDLRFLLRDNESGRSGTCWLKVTVPSFADSTVSLVPPLFMDDPGSWLVLPVQSTRTTVPASPFQVAGELFAPQAKPRMAGDRPERVCLIAFVGGRAADPGASFEITPSMVDGRGGAVKLTGVQVERAVAEGSFRWFVLTFTPQTLAPGEYTLRVRLRDPAGRVSESFRTVNVIS